MQTKALLQVNMNLCSYTFKINQVIKVTILFFSSRMSIRSFKNYHSYALPWRKVIQVTTSFSVDSLPSLGCSDSVFFFFLLTVLYTWSNSSCADSSWTDQNITIYAYRNICKMNWHILYQKWHFFNKPFTYSACSDAASLSIVWYTCCKSGCAKRKQMYRKSCWCAS